MSSTSSTIDTIPRSKSRTKSRTKSLAEGDLIDSAHQGGKIAVEGQVSGPRLDGYYGYSLVDCPSSLRQRYKEISAYFRFARLFPQTSAPFIRHSAPELARPIIQVKCDRFARATQSFDLSVTAACGQLSAWSNASNESLCAVPSERFLMSGKDRGGEQLSHKTQCCVCESKEEAPLHESRPSDNAAKRICLRAQEFEKELKGMNSRGTKQGLPGAMTLYQLACLKETKDLKAKAKDLSGLIVR